MRPPALPNVRRLAAIMDRLRGPGGCPWDLSQDHRSIRPYLLEEAHEVLAAIDDGDDERLAEELGDLLLQVIFHARMAAERGAFTLDDVARRTCAKLIERHPHVFGKMRVAGTRDVLVNWERIKARGGRRPLDGLPPALPALLAAFRVAQKLDRVGRTIPPTATLRREVAARARRVAGRGTARDVGRLLLAVAFLAARRGIDPESALREEVRRIARRHG